METEFNVRVYGVCIHNNKLLILKEPFAGSIIFKLPGGGLEFGEGPVECLQREFKEELNLTITDIEPFYIQKNYVKSAVKNNKQLVLLYFTCKILNLESLQIMDSTIQEVIWQDISDDCILDLPIDQEMFQFLLKKSKFNKK